MRRYPGIVHRDWARGYVTQVACKRALAAEAPIATVRALCAEIKAASPHRGVRGWWSVRQMVAGGSVPDDERNARLRGATVFCAPSENGESFGVVLLEAMAARTPIVASGIEGYQNVARADRDAGVSCAAEGAAR